ncbi:hypothetical protein BDQ12DRAFT_268678 [Crucibulum laeve]|uniref:Secreted protein n=1 Tax=Crucibulum laeve TaxID=68775 RepID=A0A5C3MEI6_9AGAR|nr:hypothetical protein BDQ12DRAFT_268678 [Crucibulum laeve]
MTRYALLPCLLFFVPSLRLSKCSRSYETFTTMSVLAFVSNWLSSFLKTKSSRFYSCTDMYHYDPVVLPFLPFPFSTTINLLWYRVLKFSVMLLRPPPL